MFLQSQCQEVPAQPAYASAQTDTIRAIHDLLMADLSVRYTIESLSKQFLINTTTLKDVFKAVYGQPIACYMKQRRMEHAARLLRHSKDSIAAIAAQVGYETQSKFTKAFGEVIGTTPREYRKHGPAKEET